MNGKQQKVSLDRLKPAHMPAPVLIPAQDVHDVPAPDIHTASDIATPDDTNASTEVARQTRSGRLSRLPLRFRRDDNAP